MSEIIPKIGDIFDDKYEIEEILGTGGNGMVFRALQLDCNRAVALKILHHETALDENSHETRSSCGMFPNKAKT